MPQYCEIRFLDSFQSKSQGLAGLAKTMQTSSIQLLRIKVFDMSEFDFENTRDKSFFSCNNMDSLEKYSQPFPANGDAWRISWSGKTDISERDEEEAKETHTVMRCSNFVDYHDFYSTRDVYL